MRQAQPSSWSHAAVAPLMVACWYTYDTNDRTPIESLPQPLTTLWRDGQQCSLQPLFHGSIIRQVHQIVEEEPGAIAFEVGGNAHDLPKR
jgi:hypothetical protein